MLRGPRGLAAGMVDTIFADVAQPDQARIVSINAHNYLKNQGHFVISIKVRLLYTAHHNFLVHNRYRVEINSVCYKVCQQLDSKMPVAWTDKY